MRILLHTVLRVLGVAAIGLAGSWLATALNPHDDDGLGTGLTFFLVVAMAVGAWALADGAVLGWPSLVSWSVAATAAPLLFGWGLLLGSSDTAVYDPFFLVLVGAPALTAAVVGAAIRSLQSRAGATGPTPGARLAAPPQA